MHIWCDVMVPVLADEKLPAVFYYTAVWCGPCKCLLVPNIGFLSGESFNSAVWRCR
jgi:thioredoxin 1